MAPVKCCCEQSANCYNSSPCIRTLSPDWGLSDVLGMIRVRLGFGRMSYGLWVRYFTDGAVIGSRGFVDEVFRLCRDRFGGTRKDGARKMRGNGAAAAGMLWSARDLKKGLG